MPDQSERVLESLNLGGEAVRQRAISEDVVATEYHDIISLHEDIRRPLAEEAHGRVETGKRQALHQVLRPVG